MMAVYPHTAMLVLMKAAYRVAYKVSRSRRFWPGTSVAERIERIVAQQQSILSRLSDEIADVPRFVPDPAEVKTLSRLKRYEDALNALVSAWVGMRYLEGMARAYGDETAVIWISVES